MDQNGQNEITLPLRGRSSAEALKESVHVSVHDRAGDDIDMKVVDNYNTFHTYRISRSYRDWLHYNEWPESDSDQASAESMILSDSHSDSDGDDEDEESDSCDNSSGTCL